MIPITKIDILDLSSNLKPVTFTNNIPTLTAS